MDKNFDTRYVQFDGETRSKLKDGNVLSGYAILHDVRADVHGIFLEEIAPSATVRTIQENVEVLGLFEHDWKQVLGRRSAGTLQLTRDSIGVRVSIDLPDTSLGRDVRTQVQRGDVTGFSFKITDPVYQWRMDAGKRVGRLTGMVFPEISLTSTPVYADTHASVRSLQAWEAEQGMDPDVLAMQLRAHELRGKSLYRG
jgi:uncharacterized protein